jgi:hypothetical protein
MSIKMLVPLDALEPRARLLDSTQIVREAPHQGAHVSPAATRSARDLPRMAAWFRLI